MIVDIDANINILAFDSLGKNSQNHQRLQAFIAIIKQQNPKSKIEVVRVSKNFQSDVTQNNSADLALWFLYQAARFKTDSVFKIKDHFEKMEAPNLPNINDLVNAHKNVIKNERELAKYFQDKKVPPDIYSDKRLAQAFK